MVTAAQAREITPRSRDNPLFELVVISHDDLDDGPLHFVNNTPGENITSSILGSPQIYTAVPFQSARPSKGDEVPRGTVLIPNVNRVIGQVVGELRGPLTVDLYTVYQDSPDTIVEQYAGLTLRNVSVSGLGVEGALSDDDLTNEPCPAQRVNPDLFRALFR